MSEPAASSSTFNAYKGPYQSGLIQFGPSDDGTAVGRMTSTPRRGGGKVVATRVDSRADCIVDVRVHLPRSPGSRERVCAGRTLRHQRGCAGRDEDEESDSRILLRDGRVDGGRIEPSWGGIRPVESGDAGSVAVRDGRHGCQRRREAPSK